MADARSSNAEKPGRAAFGVGAAGTAATGAGAGAGGAVLMNGIGAIGAGAGEGKPAKLFDCWGGKPPNP
jgi:hypothetical protein